MFELMLMRHAKSDWHSHTADIDRPLNDRGAGDAMRMGAYLKQMDLVPDRMLVSTAQRTQETASLLLNSFAVDEKNIILDDQLYLAGTETLDRNSNLYGKSFEQFIGMELRAYLSYRRKKRPLTYWRSKNGHEVDFLLGTRTAIEVKASKSINKDDFKHIYHLAKEIPDIFLKGVIFYNGDRLLRIDDKMYAIPFGFLIQE